MIGEARETTVRNQSEDKIIIWIDFLCWGSLFRLFSIYKKYNIKKVYYINQGRIISLIIPGITRILKIPILQLNDIIESEIKIGNTPVYQIVQQRLTRLLDEWILKDKNNVQVTGFAKKYSFDINKIREHFKEAAYFHLFRPLEIQAVSESLNQQGMNIFLFRKSAFTGVLRDYFRDQKIYFYITICAHRLDRQEREHYYYDSIGQKYFYDRFNVILKVFLFWLKACCGAILGGGKGRKRNRQKPGVKQETNIGVELLQSRVRTNEINDIYWYRDSNIDPQTICTLEIEDFDEESEQVLNQSAFQRFKLIKNPLKLIFLILNREKREYSVITADRDYILRTFNKLFLLIRPVFFWNESTWIQCLQCDFLCKFHFWVNIYRQTGIKLLWTMLDTDDSKLPKAQALDYLNGVYMGSHWSNYPLFETIIQKCYDVVFTWGTHFLTHYFNRYPFHGIFITGYPSDHYFNTWEAKAADIRNQFPGKIIISFHDNILANDIHNSIISEEKFLKVLISILDKFEQVAVLLKPKRISTFNHVKKAMPKLEKYMAEKRISVFLGETERTKVVPAQIAMASDLVIGMGISTAAAESFFSGKISVHADFTGFNSNSFSNNAVNQVVFRDPQKLRDFIEDFILNRESFSMAEFKKYYKALDPFQDGMSYSRTGFIIRSLQMNLANGMDKVEAIKRAQNDYLKFLKSLRNVKASVIADLENINLRNGEKSCYLTH